MISVASHQQHGLLAVEAAGLDSHAQKFCLPGWSGSFVFGLYLEGKGAGDGAPGGLPLIFRFSRPGVLLACTRLACL